MAVLNQDVCGAGPYLDFALMDNPIEVGLDQWPAFRLYREHVFLRMSECVVEVFCSVLSSRTVFDLYEFKQYDCRRADHRRMLNGLSTALSAQLIQLHVVPDIKLEENSWIYTRKSDGSLSSPDVFRHDLMETLLLLINKLSYARAYGKTIVVAGI